MTDVLLSVAGLNTHFLTRVGVAKAVDDVSFSVRRGEVVGLVGESGSGKSMTAYSILGLVDPPGRVVGGQILFEGRDLAELSAEEMRQLRGNRIAMIFQDPMVTLNPVLRIDTQMVEAILAHETVSRAAALERAREALGKVGIPSPDERLRAYPHQFSGGMRQRVAIAIALLNRPDLVIADEPTTALDATIQAQILKLLKRLAKDRGVSVLFTTHDLGTAYEICDRITVMYAGQEVETAPVDDFFRRPQHPYTVRLLESLPHPGRELREIGGEIPALVDPPGGCRFHPRCLRASEACRAERPAVTPIGGGHEVRCYHPVTGAVPA